MHADSLFALCLVRNHYNFNTFQMLNLLFLARSITIGLGSAELKDLPSQGDYDSERLEQMRAFAGTYYLVTMSVVSQFPVPLGGDEPRTDEVALQNLHNQQASRCPHEHVVFGDLLPGTSSSEGASHG